MTVTLAVVIASARAAARSSCDSVITESIIDEMLNFAASTIDRISIDD
jgi:hypothetical protein